MTEGRGAAAQDFASLVTRHSVTALKRHLRRGGLVAYPTESCYGLGCDPRNARAVARLLRLKGRPKVKGLILVAGDFAQLQPYLAPLPGEALNRYRTAYWPGPVTLLLPAAPDCPKWLTGRHRKLAVRVTAHDETARLCNALGMALVSTSANRAGRRPLKSAAACRRAFGERVRVVDGRIGDRRRPSTIIDPDMGTTLRA